MVHSKQRVEIIFSKDFSYRNSYLTRVTWAPNDRMGGGFFAINKEPLDKEGHFSLFIKKRAQKPMAVGWVAFGKS